MLATFIFVFFFPDRKKKMSAEKWKTFNMMNQYDKYMFFVSIFSKAFLVAQITTILINKSSEDASFLSYVLYVLGSISWLIFGFMYKNTIITLSAFLGIIGGLIAMDLVIIYKKDKTNIL